MLNFRLRGQVHLASYSPLDAAQSDIEKSFSLHPSVQTALLAAQILIYKNEFTQALKMYQIGMNRFKITCYWIFSVRNGTRKFWYPAVCGRGAHAPWTMVRLVLHYIYSLNGNLCLDSARSSIETMTIGNTHPTLEWKPLRFNWKLESDYFKQSKKLSSEIQTRKMFFHSWTI